MNKPVITVHANIDDMLKQVRQRTSSQPETLFRIGTGEHSDSLALDKTLGINQHIIKFFAGLIIGIGIGLAIDNLGVGTAIGIALGAGLSQSKIA